MEVPAAHIPVPLQDFGVFPVWSAVQTTPHDTPAFVLSQAPAPSQVPVLPQLFSGSTAQAVALRGAPAFAIAVHMPEVTPRTQLLQGEAAAVQALSQQTFSSEQTPVPQSVLTTHVSPGPSLSPHLWVDRLHVTPPAQSVLLWHVLRQETPVASQKGAHGLSLTAPQVPVALQVRGLCCTPAEQLWVLQVVAVE